MHNLGYRDESGNQRRVFTDGLGRVIEVDEPDPTNGNSLSLSTCYSYNALGNLTGVSQGSQSRTYGYDGLGRLISSVTPETSGCTTSYGYDNNGNLTSKVAPKEGQSSCATTVTTTYQYDALNRLTQKSYNDSFTPTANYYYDQTSYNGLTINYGKGRRTGMSDGSGETAWNYDALGRVLTVKQTIGTVTESASYTYNYDGSVASVTYPSGRTLSYDVTGAGAPTYAKDVSNGINYALSATYAPHGALAGLVNGQASGFNGITETVGYNNRLLPTSIVASSSAATALSLGLTYFANGNVQVVTNNRNGDAGRTETLGYDSLNRITSASSQANSGADCWGQTVPPGGYDRYGNLLNINVSKCSATSLLVNVNANNQLTGPAYSYDAAGELLGDGLYSYTWDAEGRQVTATGVTYTYDGDGRRVEKSSGTLYWYGAGGSVLAETDTSGNTTNEYIFFGGGRIARRDGSSGNVYYYFADPLGSSRTIANGTGSQAGVVCYDADFYPFGGEVTFGTTTCAQNYKFAGMERDSETTHDHTMFRQYASNLARWMSPDAIAGDITNPQSLNRYAYVVNNPATFSDPTGLFRCAGPEPPCAVANWGNMGAFLYGYGGGFVGAGGDLIPIDVGSTAEIYQFTWENSVVWSFLGDYTQDPDSLLWTYFNYGPDYEITSIPGEDVVGEVSGPMFLNVGAMQLLGFQVGPASPSGLGTNPGPQGLRTRLYIPLPGPPSAFPKNYCGPGANGGWPTNNVDAACMQHDQDYADAGISFLDRLNPFTSPQKRQAAAAADQELCGSVSNVVPSGGQEFYDAWGVSLAFGCSR